MDNKSLLFGAIIGGITASAAAFMATSKSGAELIDTAKENTKKALEFIETVQNEGLTLKGNLQNAKKQAEQKQEVHEMISSLEEMKKELEPHQEKLKSELDKLEGRISSIPDTTGYRFNWTFYFFNQTNNTDCSGEVTLSGS